MKRSNDDSYEDIFLLPHPTSVTHPRMPAEHRAAQFSPFAALTGYEEAILETEYQKKREDEDEYGSPEERMEAVDVIPEYD